MLKSNFSRYLVTFALLIFLSFLTITAITSYITFEYAKNNKITLTNKLSEAVFEEINDGLEEYNGSFNATILRVRNQFTYADRFAKTLEFFIFITDTKGTILYSSGTDPDMHLSSRIPSKTVKSFLANPTDTRYNSLGGFLPQKYYNTSFLIKNPNNPDSDILGVLFISTPSTGIDHTVGHMISAIVIALIWVFGAAFTALYFISERLNKPILLLKEKFETFAGGDFTVRMPQTGVSEIDRIGDSFNDMAASLEKIENSRRTFLCNISHDLRTPMTGIQGFVEAILDGTIKPENEKYYLSIISKEIKRLSRMVNELLDISRIEAGTLRLNKSVFDICEMARLIVISLEERLLTKNIEFNLTADNYHSFVYADKDSIYQVLYNLIDNAVKFTNENGRLHITVTHDVIETDENTNAIKNENLKYHISVYNTGIGIPNDAQSHIFDRFYKTDNSRGKDKTGIGIGLFIVKTVIELHEEQIEVSSVENEYCEFTFTLPYAEKPAKNAVNDSFAPPNVMPLKQNTVESRTETIDEIKKNQIESDENPDEDSEKKPE